MADFKGESEFHPVNCISCEITSQQKRGRPLEVRKRQGNK